jgi:hypothetical protein
MHLVQAAPAPLGPSAYPTFSIPHPPYCPIPPPYRPHRYRSGPPPEPSTHATAPVAPRCGHVFHAESTYQPHHEPLCKGATTVYCTRKSPFPPLYPPYTHPICNIPTGATPASPQIATDTATTHRVRLVQSSSAPRIDLPRRALSDSTVALTEKRPLWYDYGP